MTPRAGNPTRDVPIPWHVRRCRQTHRARGPRTPGARRRRHRVYSRCGSRCARHRVARCRECGLMHRSTQPTRVVRPTAAVPPARPSQRAMAGRRFERSRGVARQILARRRRCGRCRPPRAMCKRQNLGGVRSRASISERQQDWSHGRDDDACGDHLSNGRCCCRFAEMSRCVQCDRHAVAVGRRCECR